VAGTYFFSATGDDGSRLFVNGQELVNNWRDGYAITGDGSVSLSVGQQVPIEIDYDQDGGGSELFVGAQAPDSTSLIVQAAQLAAKSNVAIVVASLLEGEATDLTSIDLPGLQNQLIEAVAAANPNTIVVLNTGSAVTMPWLSQVAGVLEAWYPGQEDGTSIAPLLFGYGLSYTSFSFSNLALSSDSGSPSSPLTVTVNVTNTGSRAGAEVAAAVVVAGR
jgi:beta-glucosidase